ncbi:hypothetical protein ASE92_03240 [Pedobacter sp. Leaf41]|uniref:hypothetical protein n=1 Tax=Pedobacter sp. Leaf41 TaxID=1736218 RepID=UPI000702E320|nr:hypothetical protein [Pedobacter sp. Leaf41]KQN38464.1 hypothetical protein ASE92_03240 [Pedobacter sp. Leaf41]
MKKMWLGIGITLAIGLAVSLYYYNNRLIIDRNDAPLEEKYASFQKINEHYRSAVFDVKFMARVVVSSAASPNPIRIFESVNDQLIIDCDAEVDEDTKHDNRYYKIDKAGKLLDSIYVAYGSHWANFIGEFIVYTSDRGGYYNSWPLDGDTTRHEVIEWNKDNSWTNERISAKIKAIKATGKYHFSNSLVNQDVWYLQTYFYEDKKWQLLWQQLPGYFNVPDEESPIRYRKEVFRSGEVDFQIPKDVKLLYFYQEEKMKYYHVIGGGGGGFSVYNWRGKGFFETEVAGKKFEFMVPKLVVEKERHNGFKPSLFTVEEAGSATDLFTPAFYHSPNGFSFYSPSPKLLYLIKVRQ